MLLAHVLAGCTAPVHVDWPTAGAESTCPKGNCLTDPEEAAVRRGWSQVAVDETGRAWMTFAEVDGPFVTGLYVTWSDGPGLPLAPAVEVPLVATPNVGTTEKPSLAVSSGRLAIAYTGSAGAYRHGDADALFLHTATVSAEGVQFDAAQVVDDLDGFDLVIEHGRVAFDADGDLWVLWKRQSYGESDYPMWARESGGFEPSLVSSALSNDHDCSPPDFHMDRNGLPLLGIRSNLGGWLETMAVIGDPAGGNPHVVQLSNDQWRYAAEVCPEDGPRLVRLADGTLFSGWLTPTDFAWRMMSSWSTDNGRTWTAPDEDHGGVDLGETWVAIVATDEGPFHTAVEGLDRTTRLLTRDTPNGSLPFNTLVDRPLVGDDGADLVNVELSAGGGRAVAVGTAEDRTLWLVDL